MSKPCWFQGQAGQKQRDRLSRKYVEGMVWEINYVMFECYFQLSEYNDVHTKDEVVSDKVPTLQQTKSLANVHYSKDLPIEQEEDISGRF